MTSERRLLLGFDDIRAVTFECKHCAIRLTVAPDKMTEESLVALRACPSGCGQTWISASSAMGPRYTSTMAQFLILFPRLLESQKQGSDISHGVRVLFEFDDAR